ncbi:hypothetical protein D3C87_1641160 [compost metagenome]
MRVRMPSIGPVGGLQGANIPQEAQLVAEGPVGAVTGHPANGSEEAVQDVGQDVAGTVGECQGEEEDRSPFVPVSLHALDQLQAATFANLCRAWGTDPDGMTGFDFAEAGRPSDGVPPDLDL